MIASLFKRKIWIAQSLLGITLLLLLLPVTALSHPVNKGAIVLLVVKDEKGVPFSNGTGFIVKPDGTLITNYHVLVGASSVDAILADGTQVGIKGIVKVDRTKDFCILKLEGDRHSTIELGDSNKLNNFDYTSALGYPSHTVRNGRGGLKGILLQTHGFVLGKHPQAFPDFPYIYTTAEFSPGFSGGPLLNIDNQVVGLSTLEGRSINLALPINLVKSFLDEKNLISFKQLMKDDQSSKETFYYKGNFALYGLGDPDQAIKYYQQALEIDSSFVPAQYDLAVAYRNKGSLDKTIRQYEKVIGINPDFPEALSNLGGQYFRQGKVKKALKMFKRAVAAYPNFIQALSNLGAVLTKVGKPDEALPYLEKAVSLDPEFGITYFNLGNAHFQLKQYSKAKEAFDAALRMGVDFLSIHWKLYEIHIKAGRTNDAVKELMIILQIDPGNKEAREKLKGIN